LARKAQRSFSGEDLAIKNPSKTGENPAKIAGWKSENPAFLRGILTL
jgi:hypothetical protein